MFESILVAVDGSPQGARATELAGALAQRFHSDVVVLHVRERMSSRPDALDAYEPGVDLDVGEEAARELKDMGVEARVEQPSARFGRVAQTIVGAAEANDSRMIVMGSRGRSEVTGLLLGSTTHKVLHLASCPVLIAR